MGARIRFSELPDDLREKYQEEIAEKKARTRKFRNVPTIVDGIRFDSKKEAKRWGQLKLMEQAGEISKLERQTKFDIVINKVLVTTYSADFTYLDRDGNEVVEDVKSPITRRDPKYRIKFKLMKAMGHPITEV